MRPAIKLGLSAFAGLVLAQAAGAAELKIALIAGKTGPLEAYAKQTETGLMMGLEYLTKGTMEANGRKVTVIVKDDQLKADLAKTLLGAGLFGRQGRHCDRNIIVGGRACHASCRGGAGQGADRRAGRRGRDHRREME